MKANVRVWTLSLGTFAAVTFTLSVLYGLIAPSALHGSRLLEMMLPGFQWLTFGSFVLGLVETFVFGAYFGFVFSIIYNFFSGRAERRAVPVRRMAA